MLSDSHARLFFFRWLCEVDETHESQKASAVEFKVVEKCDIGLLFFSRALMRFAFFSQQRAICIFFSISSSRHDALRAALTSAH